MGIGVDIAQEQKLSRDTSERISKLYAEKGQPVSCVSGCFHCCKLDVACLPQEVEVLADKVISGEVGINLDRLERKVRGSKDSEDSWCPFLEGGKCSVYNNRPMMCSRMLVVSPKENCEEDSDKTKTQVFHNKMDKRYGILFSTFGRVILHHALFNMLVRGGMIQCP